MKLGERLQVKRAAFVGIGGSGMRGLAKLLGVLGIDIIGTDSKLDEFSGANDLKGVSFFGESEVQAIKGCGLLIYSDAILENHPWRERGRALGVKEVSYFEAVGEITKVNRTIGVAGTHGKSSTTAMLGYIFEQAGLDPSVLLGAMVKDWGGNARVGSGDLFIVEADEYRNHFLALHPQSIIITNIDFDHPDFFSSVDDVLRSFYSFLQLLPKGGQVVVPVTVRERWPEIDWPPNILEVTVKDAEHIELPLPGNHFKQNAALAVAMAGKFGVRRTDAVKFLTSLPVIGRRLELIGRIHGIKVLSDYGHHPAEIEATLRGIRMIDQEMKVLVIIEIHTLERLTAFIKEFINALKPAHGVMLVPIYMPAGRKDGSREGSKDTLAAMEDLLAGDNREVHVLQSFRHLSDELGSMIRNYDIAVAFSAGRLDGELRKVLGK